jgi:hypothetical protein
MKMSLFVVGIFMLMVSGQADNDKLVWTEKGCDTEYMIGESITIYFTPKNGEVYELWAYDAVMNERLVSGGIGDGGTFTVTETVTPPAGLLTYMLKMPCETECELCELCDFDQCTIQVKGEDPCKDHCTNKIQDCGEYGVDCGGGCLFKDADSDGIEDCKDACPDSRCHRVDDTGCETDADADKVLDCEDDCPGKKGDPAHRGCPGIPLNLVVGVVIVIVIVGLAVWKMRHQ